MSVFQKDKTVTPWFKGKNTKKKGKSNNQTLRAALSDQRAATSLQLEA